MPAEEPAPPPPALPPGWYADPQLPTRQRWWDGTQWTLGTRKAPARLTVGNPFAAAGCGFLLLIGGCMAYGACSKAHERQASRAAQPIEQPPPRSLSAGPEVSDPVRVEAKLEPAPGRVGHETALRVMVHRYGVDPTGFEMQVHLASELTASRVIGGSGKKGVLGVYTAECTEPVVVGADYWCSSCSFRQPLEPTESPCG